MLIYDERRRELAINRAAYPLLLHRAHCSVLTAPEVSRITYRPLNLIARAVHRLLNEAYLDRAPDFGDEGQARLKLTDKVRAAQSNCRSST